MPENNNDKTGAPGETSPTFSQEVQQIVKDTKGEVLLEPPIPKSYEDKEDGTFKGHLENLEQRIQDLRVHNQTLNEHNANLDNALEKHNKQLLELFRRRHLPGSNKESE